MSEAKLPWYKDGLKFKCTECGKCCTGQPGFVWTTDAEVEAMAKKLHMTVQAFKMRYIRKKENRLALVEKKVGEGDKACIFLKEKRCEIYEARPQQCRTFPWWKENLQSEESWKVAALGCEGISEKASVVKYEAIQQLLD